MIWTIILLVIIFLLLLFVFALVKDKQELDVKPLENRIRIIISEINDTIFDGKAKITVLDTRTMNLYLDGANSIVQFHYGTGNLTITYRTKSVGEEIVCERMFSNVRDITDNYQKFIAETFLKHVEKRLVANQAVHNVDNKEKEWNGNKTKYELSMMFYQFCFSPETAAIFLQENETRSEVALGIALSVFEQTTLVEAIFKDFLSKKYNLTLYDHGLNLYQLYELRFHLYTRRVRVFGNDSYFEILYHDFTDVVDGDGQSVSTAREFVVYVKDNLPIALFVVLFDVMLDKYAVRRVYENGSSVKLTFVEKNQEAELLDFITRYVLEKL